MSINRSGLILESCLSSTLVETCACVMDSSVRETGEGLFCATACQFELWGSYRSKSRSIFDIKNGP